MITYAEVDKLRHLRTADPAVLSLYLWVSADPAGQRVIEARADALIQESRHRVPDADRNALAALLAARGRQWPGRMVAIFASGELGLLEALVMPCRLHERAVFATSPHVLPLLTAMRRCPAYHAAIIDLRHGWLMSVAGDDTSVTRLPDTGVRRDPGSIAASLEEAAGTGGPIVIGGHPDGIPKLLRMLTDQVRAQYAGSFAADPHALTPERARQLADPVVADWVRRSERRLADELSSGQPGVAAGLETCLIAVNNGAVSTLAVADDQMIAGFVCGRCGALSVTGDDCPDWGTAARPVPDLLEEMACRVLDDGGEVVAVRNAGFEVAARLRFALT